MEILGGVRGGGASPGEEMNPGGGVVGKPGAWPLRPTSKIISCVWNNRWVAGGGLVAAGGPRAANWPTRAPPSWRRPRLHDGGGKRQSMKK